MLSQKAHVGQYLIFWLKLFFASHVFGQASCRRKSKRLRPNVGQTVFKRRSTLKSVSDGKRSLVSTLEATTEKHQELYRQVVLRLTFSILFF
jgi:hypothetical protein